MSKSPRKPKKEDKLFYSLHPSLPYTEYVNLRKLDRNATNIGYKSTLESLQETGTRACRKQAMIQKARFSNRHDPTSEFGKIYKDYWESRDLEDNETTPDSIPQQLQRMASANTINLAQMAWGEPSKRKQTSHWQLVPLLAAAHLKARL